MTLRRDFVILAAQDSLPFIQLCARFKISAKTGYKWLKRYRADGADGLVDQSRRPKGHPRRTAAAVEAKIVALRQERGWGCRKLVERLEALGHANVPARSTVTAVLHRHELISAAESAKRKPLIRFERALPNQLWQMDFKGHFATRRGARCHPLTILDDHSRYSLGIEACSDERAETVQARLTLVFARYGLPEEMLTDNGTPWGNPQDPFTAFEVWLLRLGVRLIHGRPYHPQTQGKEERFHRTLKAEVLSRFDLLDLPDCQHRFDQWREVYNHERPHEALAGKTPGSRYAASRVALPKALPPIEYDPTDDVRTVRPSGIICLRGRTFLIGRAFASQPVALRATGTEDLYDAYFCHQKLGRIDLRYTKKARFHLYHLT
jgi:transposase InsO family protein